MLATVLVVGLVLVAAVTDAREHKIYNWTTYPGIGAALGLNAAGSWLERAGHSSDRLSGVVGWVGLPDSLAGFLACGFAMLVCFVMFRIGGGDVKLMAMIGAFLGLEQGVEAMLWTFVLGGCLAVLLLIWRVGFWSLAGRVVKQVLWTLRLRQLAPLSDDERRLLAPPLFLAPCAVPAVLMVRLSLF